MIGHALLNVVAAALTSGLAVYSVMTGARPAEVAVWVGLAILSGLTAVVVAVMDR